MNLDDDESRFPIPKWRSLQSTPTSELMSSARGHSFNEELAFWSDSRLQSLYERWHAIPSIDNALEVLDCSVLVQKSGLFEGPARQVLLDDQTTETSKFVARRILGIADPTDPIEGESYGIAPSNINMIRRLISENRKRLKDEVRNGLLHAEQARLYSLIGEYDHARNSFRVALGVTPDNRHILRSYARFMCHLDGSTHGEAIRKALERLRRSVAIKTDPWVQAAEISLSGLAQTGSAIAREASRNIDAKRVPENHLSELAITLAVLEREAGNMKRFKKRWRASLLHSPSDNALAQTMWLMKKEDSFVSDSSARMIRSFLQNSEEATTYLHLRDERWNEAVKGFLNWQREESFSSRIAIQGSFCAISYARDYRSAIDMCKKGELATERLKQQPKQFASLLNNLCVAQRRAGLLDDARSTLESLQKLRTGEDWRQDPTFLATDAMMSFADGRVDHAREQYMRAINIAADKGDSLLKIRLKMHWAYEEVATVGDISTADTKRLCSAIEKSSDLDLPRTNEEKAKIKGIRVAWRLMNEEMLDKAGDSDSLRKLPKFLLSVD